MISRFIRLIILSFLVLILASTDCFSGGAVEQEGRPAPDTAGSIPKMDFPVTITDGLNRAVTVSNPPQRIISLSPANTEILFAVGAGRQVIGITEYCNYPLEAKSLAKIGGFAANTISLEKIISLKPDLVLSEAGIHRPIIEALEGSDIPVVALKASTLADVKANIRIAGRLTGHEEESVRLVSQMEERLKAVTEKVAGVAEQDRLFVFWEIFDEPLMTVGPTTFTGQAIELAGGINIFADVTEQYPKISPEEILQRNPSVIMSFESHGDKLTPEQIANRPGWARIKAVHNGRIHLIDGDIASRPGPRLVDAIEAMARALYPELFE